MKRKLLQVGRALRPRPPERHPRPAREIVLAVQARRRLEERRRVGG